MKEGKEGKEQKNKYHRLNRFLVIMDVILAAFLIYLEIPSMKKENAGRVTQSQEEKEYIEEVGFLRGAEKSLKAVEAQKAAQAQTAGEEPAESGEDGETQEKETKSGETVYPLVAGVGADVSVDMVIDSEGIYCIYTGEKYGFMTENGKKLVSADNNDPFIYDVAYPFHEGLACVCIDRKYGYIDTNGEVAIPLVYDRATPFMEGLAYFAVGDTCGFMDHTGNVVFELTCDSVSSFQEGLAYFSVDGQYGYLDQNGQIVIDAAYDDAEYFRNGLARVRKGSGYGVIGRDGSYILKPEYDSIEIKDDFIEAKKEGQSEYFDIRGKRLPYDLVLSSNYLLPYSVIQNPGLIKFYKDGKAGLADDAGTILFEPVYDCLDVVSQQGIVMVKKDEKWGVADLDGELLIPFQYSDIRYMPCDDQTGGGILIVSDEEGRDGILDAAELSWVIPCIYDSINSYSNGRAAVRVGGEYGVVDLEGNVLVPIEYSATGFFGDGTIYAREKSGQYIIWHADETVKLGYLDQFSREGEYYMIKKNDQYGFLNESGKVVLPAVYQYVSNSRVYPKSDIYLASRYSWERNYFIVKTGESENAGISGLLLKNEITPMAEVYWEFVKDSFISGVGWFRNDVADQKELNGCREIYKLFDLEHTGELVLYFYASPYLWEGFPMSYSGFYGVQDGQLVQLLSGYECGGSGGGNYVCLQYDRVKDVVVLGSCSHYGGFSGNAYGGGVYDYRNGEAQFVTSFMCTAESASNYTEEDLTEHAELFYGGEEEDIPFTGETIREAYGVTHYEVNGEWCSVEAYREKAERYRKILFLR